MKAEIWVDDWTAVVALVRDHNRHTDPIFLQALTLLTVARYWFLHRCNRLYDCQSLRQWGLDRLLKKHTIGLHQGFGHHFEILPKDYLTTFGKNFFTGEILYFLTIGVVKCSILAFYWRLFRASIRVPCCILGAVTICWEIAVVSAFIRSNGIR